MESKLGCARLLLLLGLLGRVSAALTEGGPSTFGYDASSSCSKPVSRTGRARLELPCDFSRENWCTIAGHAYPWQAVRRFVQENQGLMRRMYGDEKHISVLKSELEKNDVELELENEQAHFYYDDTSPLYRQFQLDYEFEQEDDGVMESRETRGSRALNAGSSGKLKQPMTEEPLRRQSQPNETPVTTGQPTGASNATSSSVLEPELNNGTSTVTPIAETATTPQRNTSTTTTTTNAPLTSTTTSTQRATSASTTTSTTTSTAKAVVSLEQIANVQNLSINEIGIPGQIDRLDLDVDDLTETTESGQTTLKLEPIVAEEAEEDSQSQESQLQPQQFRPRPEYRPPAELATAATTASGSAGTLTEGQLFQDVAAKDKQEQPVLKVRGINACPVKEEVVAPFWANNTRGEVLALLNLYPFEQYVHWEKCTHENKQMYCRDGCRCEQQYRLHRLLAYDPNNECRGIFSDWFKFPSCCICRCYDLPLEFRVTSRSPRLASQAPKRKIKVRAPRRPPRLRRH